MKNISIIYCTI